MEDRSGNQFELVTVIDSHRQVVGNYIIDHASNMIEVFEDADILDSDYVTIDVKKDASVIAAHSVLQKFEKVFIETEVEVNSYSEIESLAESESQVRTNSEIEAEISAKVAHYQSLSETELMDLGVSM